MSEQKRKIFFERDAAGLSNVRLQLESLLVIAALTDRQLVLPPPSSVHHLSKPYHEGDLWSLKDLCRHVDIILQKDGAVPATADHLRKPLAEVTFDAAGKPCVDSGLRASENWYFPMGHSRIQHFECLKLATAEQKKTAARVVLESLELAKCHRIGAMKALQHLKLAPGEYVAVHIRRGDFEAFRPDTQASGKTLAATSQGLCSAGGLPLLLASDASPSDQIFKDFASACHVPVKVTAQAYQEHDDDLSRAAMDMLACAWAQKFVGTPDSTFSTSIMGLRAKANLRDASIDAKPQYFLQGKANLEETTGLCWSKPTTYAALREDPLRQGVSVDSPAALSLGWAV